MNFLTASEVAERFGVSRSTIERMVTRGEIGAYQLPSGTIRFSEFEIEQFLQSCRRDPTPQNEVAQ